MIGYQAAAQIRCTARPEGRRYVLDNFARLYDWATDLEPKWVMIWPYDSGGWVWHVPELAKGVAFGPPRPSCLRDVPHNLINLF